MSSEELHEYITGDLEASVCSISKCTEVKFVLLMVNAT